LLQVEELDESMDHTIAARAPGQNKDQKTGETMIAGQKIQRDTREQDEDSGPNVLTNDELS